VRRSKKVVRKFSSEPPGTAGQKGPRISIISLISGRRRRPGRIFAKWRGKVSQKGAVVYSASIRKYMAIIDEREEGRGQDPFPSLPNCKEGRGRGDNRDRVNRGNEERG